MRYLLALLLLACAEPTDNRVPPTSVDEQKIVHPKSVTVTMTPADQSVYPGGVAQYVAVARDGQGRVLRPSSWVWSTSDTTIAIVSQTGLATGLRVGYVKVIATAYPPWTR